MIRDKKVKVNVNRLCRYHPYVLEEPDAPPDISDLPRPPKPPSVAPTVPPVPATATTATSTATSPSAMAPPAPSSSSSPAATPALAPPTRASRRVRNQRPESTALQYGGKLRGYARVGMEIRWCVERWCEECDVACRMSAGYISRRASVWRVFIEDEPRYICHEHI